MMDFCSYEWFVCIGCSMLVDFDVVIVWVLYDFLVMFDVGWLIVGCCVVGIMGGYQLLCDFVLYCFIVELGCDFVCCGMLVCMGGGFGVMEVGYVGVLLVQYFFVDFQVVIVELLQQLMMFNFSWIVVFDGIFDFEFVCMVGSWFVLVWMFSCVILQFVESLLILIWYYGYELILLFVMYIVKFFQNSICEDGLLMVVCQGIVFMWGSVGILYEIFQDVEQNFYVGGGQVLFSLMVFFDSEYWIYILFVWQLVCLLFVIVVFQVCVWVDEFVLVIDDIYEVVEYFDCFVVGLLWLQQGDVL